jgi:hypothetical protein
MLARHCSQIAAQENTLGRHYSRFRRRLRTAHEQYQLLARPRNVKIAIAAVESAKFG